MAGQATQGLDEGAYRLGYTLAEPGHGILPALEQLSINLSRIGCDPTLDTQAIREGWPTDNFAIASPPFRRAVRTVTSSIIFRQESLVDSMPPIGSRPVYDDRGEARNDVAWAPSSAVDVDKAVKDASEGAVWVDPDEARYRAGIIACNASLLRSVRRGMAARGYPATETAYDMRQEFNETLDELWSKGSYHSFPASKVVAKIMRETGLRKPSDTLRDARRFKSFGRDYGYGLALMRFLPDAVLAELK